MLSLLLKPWVASCGETRERMSDYLDDELRPRTRTRVVRHLSRCKHCQALLASLTRTLDELRSLGSVEAVASAPATASSVLERIRADRR